MNDDTFYINLRKNKPEILKSYITQLRDCFTAGYTMPQFCIDNNIKRPLFVALDENYKDFLWELYVQFQYCKNTEIVPQFAMISGSVNSWSYYYAYVAQLKIENISDINLEKFDRIILLFFDVGNSENKYSISLDKLANYFVSRTQVEIPILHFVSKNPGVKFVVINHPAICSNIHNSERENKLLEESAMGPNRPFHTVRQKIKEDKSGNVETPFDFLGYTNEEVYRLMEIPEAKSNLDGSISMCDTDDNLLNIVNGKRTTAYQPSRYKNTIYFIGHCVYYGVGVPFDKTIESLLQKMLNDNNLPYRVENESQVFGQRYQDIFYNLNKLPVKSGDIIFAGMPHPVLADFIGNKLKPSSKFVAEQVLTKKWGLNPFSIPYWDLTSILDRPHNYGEVFADFCHINELGHKALAEKFYEMLVLNNFFRDTEFNYPSPPPPPHRYGIPKENSFDATNLFSIEELEEYKKELREKRVPIGSVLMNCNPFTLGHEYLVEYASARVYKLYIFVVEADLSEFPFAERFEMVKRGVKKFSNVEVLPSRQFAASMKTISGYFNRPEIVDETVDTSTDAYVFANEIAPSLGINMRFVGEENSDAFTHKYNESLKSILPQYGIKVYEIPRKEVNGEAISAKKIRAALNVGDFDTVAKFVPVTTLEFLKQNYSKK